MQIMLSPASSHSRQGLGVPSEGQAPPSGPLGAEAGPEASEDLRSFQSVSLPFPRLPLPGY